MRALRHDRALGDDPFGTRAAAAILVLAAREAVSGGLCLAHGLVPSPSAIVGRVVADGVALYASAAVPTLIGAGLGWVVGNAAGVISVALAAAAPSLGGPLRFLALAGFCMPGVALGPILAVVGSPEVSRVVLAALPIAFLTMETLASNAEAVPAGARDAARAFGGSRLGALACLDLPASVPSLLTALRISVPFALLGAVSADFLGAERGSGVLLVAAQHRLMVDRAWAVALLLAVVAASASAALTAVERRVAPWSSSVPIEPAAAGRGHRSFGGGRAVDGCLRLSLGIATVVATWWAVPHLLHLSPTVAKGPLDVIGYLADPAAGGERRGRLVGEMLVTVGDSAMGLVCGAACAVVCAAATAAVRPLRDLVIGPALVVQCLPIVAFTPLLVLAFGRGAGLASGVGALVILVPLLLRLWAALSRTPRALTDLARIHGAARAGLILHVLIPAAVPSLLAAVRTAAPLACSGALLAEWLATGRGAGYGMLAAAAASDYAAVWARVTGVTALAMSFYGALDLVEKLTLARRHGVGRVEAFTAKGRAAPAMRFNPKFAEAVPDAAPHAGNDRIQHGTIVDREGSHRPGQADQQTCEVVLTRRIGLGVDSGQVLTRSVDGETELGSDV